MKENRKHVYNKLVTMAFDKVAPSLQQEVKVEDKDWKPVSPEERERRLAELKELIDNSVMLNGMPRVPASEVLKNGDWKPARLEPRSDIQKAMIVEDHIARVRAARAKVFRTYYPDASAEEVEAYCDKFSDV